MTALRWVGAVVLLLVGAVTAVAAVAVHMLWWGLPLAAVAVTAAMAAVGRGWLTRLPLALGFVSMVALLLPRRAEGDYVIASNLAGMLLLVLCFVILLVALVTLPRPRRAAESVAAAPPT